MALMLIGPVEAVSSVAGTDNTITHSLLTGSGVPVQLFAGVDGATTVGSANTSVVSHVTGGQLSASTYNTTHVENKGSQSVRVRIAFVSWTGTTTDCVTCNIELRRSSTTASQIVISNGVVTQSVGSWVTIDGTGGAATKWYVYAVARRTVLADNVVPVDYSIEIAPSTSLSPSVQYHNNTMEFTV